MCDALKDLCRLQPRQPPNNSKISSSSIKHAWHILLWHDLTSREFLDHSVHRSAPALLDLDVLTANSAAWTTASPGLQWLARAKISPVFVPALADLFWLVETALEETSPSIESLLSLRDVAWELMHPAAHPTTPLSDMLH
ncbi:hypothetical protein SNOG_04103 [Parastagonospora nodorum SN15]|uniref:Uncharacterized protein n=1 Tax=Phaeosphaeria nodorum (strain SN15 / ATCC MYA-4574 / FGSC 10173) TaxID=321614 RepID=Q0UVW1_PHANO|nr:hypothetical protein SNOG_04103 [Parastagonospora nodorum SN15]EAT87863.1 hypothetical protein SNOG_04103 [Parastagonospora nodorum SN15]